MRSSNGDPGYVEDDFAPDQEGRIQEWFAALLRGKWLLALAVLVGLGLMAWQTSRQKPVYEAATLVLINPKGGQDANPFGDMMGGGPSNKLANEIYILKTLTVAEGAAEVLLSNPYVDAEGKVMLPAVQDRDSRSPVPLLAPRDVVAGRIGGSVEFSPQRESDIIKIVAKSNSPQEASAIANAYAEAYQKQTMLQSRSRSRAAREFLEVRLSEQRDSLSKAEAELRNFMEGAGIVSLDQESDQVVTEIASLEATRNALDMDIQSGQKKLLSLQSELPKQESRVATAVSQANDAYITELQTRVGQLEAQRDVIIAQNDPAVLSQPMYKQRLTDLDNQITALKQRLQERSARFIESFLSGESVGGQEDALGYLRGLKTQLLETRFQLETQASRRNALDNTLAQYESRFRQIPRKSMEFARLQRNKKTLEHLYSMVDERYNQVAITEKSEFGYVDIVDRATVPSRPVSPDLRRNLMLGLFLGFGGGFALLVLRSLLDVRARTPEQLRRRGYVPLAEVSPMAKEIRQLKRDGRLASPIKRLDPSLWLSFDPMSMIAEAYRRLRTILLRTQVENPVKVVLMTSANPGEGKTTTACNLALTLAETNKRVILLDADIRKPRIHTMFGVPNKPGLTDFVAGKADMNSIIQKQIVEGLDFISCGSMAAQPSRVFSSEGMFALLDLVRAQYDFMIIDAPPALVVNDAAVLAGVVDRVIVVAASGGTRLAALDKTRDVIRAARGKMLGVVLNRFDARKEYGGYYGGVKYGHYGQYRGYYSADGGGEKSKAKQILKRFARTR